MIQKKKYPKIEPQFIKDNKGKRARVYLPYSIYESIVEEVRALELSIKKLKKAKS